MEESIFIGAFIATLLVGFFSDAIGRKKTILYSLIICIVGILLIVAINNLIVRCIGLLFWGIGSDILFPVGITYVIEIIA